jgi:hypothetical protein
LGVFIRDEDKKSFITSTPDLLLLLEVLLLLPQKRSTEKFADAFVRKLVDFVVGVDPQTASRRPVRTHPEKLGRPLHRLRQDVLQSWGHSPEVGMIMTEFC